MTLHNINLLSFCPFVASNHPAVVLKQKYRYSRPGFIGLESEDELIVSSDTIIRPILVPRDLNKLRWNSGYAE